MILSDQDIALELGAGQLRVDPLDPAALQPASVDLRLDRSFRVFINTGRTHIDPTTRQDSLTRLVSPEPGAPFVLHPGEFALGTTLERVQIPDYLTARLEGKSSLGRLGLVVHSTAGFIDPGFVGQITLELSNAANLPILLWPRMWVGQLCLLRMTSPALYPYGSPQLRSRYQHQDGPTCSHAHLNSGL